MGQKDKVKKQLLDYDDVFADVVNTLILQNDKIGENELLAADTESVYKTQNGKYVSQYRDISKYWQRKAKILAVFAVENQTTVDKEMVLRVIGYDGAKYRSQYRTGKHYPVITFVLNFSNKRWNDNYKSIIQIMEIPEELKKSMINYKINVVDVAFLDEKTRNRFQSDFKKVADFFYKRRVGEEPLTGEEILQHPLEYIDFLKI